VFQNLQLVAMKVFLSDSRWMAVRDATTSPAWLAIAALVSLLAILAVVVPTTFKALDGSTAKVAISTPITTGSFDSSNDGADPLRPVLPPADKRFVDKRGGWGWSDRCWLNIKAQKWGWARAECDRGMALNPSSPQPMSSLLYNQGLIAVQMGDIESARNLMSRSLGMREHPEVRAAYQSLP
jgi:hypothetical protein